MNDKRCIEHSLQIADHRIGFADFVCADRYSFKLSATIAFRFSGGGLGTIGWVSLFVTMVLTAVLVLVYLGFDKLYPVVTAILGLLTLHRAYTVFASIWSLITNLEHVTPFSVFITTLLDLFTFIPFVWFTIQSLGTWTNIKLLFLQKLWFIPAVLMFIPGIAYAFRGFYYASLTSYAPMAAFTRMQMSLSLISSLIWSGAFSLLSKWLYDIHKASIQTENHNH